jgi:hypothetical protein
VPSRIGTSSPVIGIARERRRGLLPGSGADSAIRSEA